MVLRAGTLAASSIVLASPALAHAGDHSHYSLAEMASHLLQWDHLFIIGLAGLIGLAAFLIGRRSEARRVRSDRDGSWRR